MTVLGGIGRGVVCADGGNSGAECKALEDLVEEDDDKKGDEKRVAGNDKGQSDDWRKER